MASTINAYSVSLGLDAADLIKGANLSRREISSLTRDIEASRTPLEKYGMEYDRLEKAYQQGAISLGVYERLLNSAKDKYLGVSQAASANAAEQERINKLTKEGESLTLSMLTAEEKHAREVKNLDELLKSQSIGTQTYNRALGELNKKLYESSDAFKKAQEAEKKADDLKRQGESVTKSLMTAEEKHAAEIKKLDALLKSGTISQDTFNRGVKASEAALRESNPELQRHNKLMQEGESLTKAMLTPLERYNQQLARIRELYRTGAISTETMNRATADARTKFEATNASALGLSGSLSKMGIAFGTVAAGSAAIIGSGVALNGWLRRLQNDIDDAADKAQRLGLSFNEMKGLDFAFKLGSGLDSGQVEEGIKKLQLNIAKAVEGDTGLRAAFSKLGLDAATLSVMPVQDAMLRVSDAMSNVANHGERMRLSMELMGKSGAEFAATLGDGSSKLQEQLDYYERYAKLSQEQLFAIAETNDLWDKFSLVISGISNKIAAEFAVGMNLIASDAVKAAEAAATFDSWIASTVDRIFIMSAGLQDVDEMLRGFLTGGLQGDFDWDKARATEEKLAALREKFAQEAESKRLDDLESRMSAWSQMMQAQEDRKFAREVEAFERKMKIEDEATRRRNSDALKNAEKHFEQERQRQMALRDELAKGPTSLSVGSADFVKFQAEQINKRFADSAALSGPPTQEQLLEEAKRQRELTEQNMQLQQDLLFELQQNTQATKESVIVRAR